MAGPSILLIVTHEERYPLPYETDAVGRSARSSWRPETPSGTGGSSFTAITPDDAHVCRVGGGGVGGRGGGRMVVEGVIEGGVGW